jgi:hypothetical protein
MAQDAWVGIIDFNTHMKDADSSFTTIYVHTSEKSIRIRKSDWNFRPNSVTDFFMNGLVHIPLECK